MSPAVPSGFTDSWVNQPWTYVHGYRLPCRWHSTCRAVGTQPAVPLALNLSSIWSAPPGHVAIVGPSANTFAVLALSLLCGWHSIWCAVVALLNRN